MCRQALSIDLVVAEDKEYPVGLRLKLGPHHCIPSGGLEDHIIAAAEENVALRLLRQKVERAGQDLPRFYMAVQLSK